MRPAVRDYALLSGFALLVMTVVLQQEGLGLFGLLPLVIGGLGLLVSSSFTPPLVLLLVTLSLTMRERILGLPFGLYRHPPSLLSELGLALSLLVYLPAAFRLRTLTHHAVPPRQRRRRAAGRAAGRWALRGTPSERTAREAGPELMTLVLTAAVATVLGYILWGVVSLEERPEWVRFPRPVWRAMLLAWAAAVALVVAGGLLGYLKALFAGRDASLLHLQDQLWSATRREQRRNWRWLTWARLRRERKKEGGR
jgi:hypothetical protein